MSSSHFSLSDQLWRSRPQLRGLTVVRFLSKLNSLIIEGAAVAFVMPHMIKRAVFLVSATIAPRWVLVINWRSNVRVTVRSRRPSISRGALFRLFVSNSQIIEVSHV